MTLFLPRELTAVITVLTEMGDTSHSIGRLMRGKEIKRVVVVDRWMDGGIEQKIRTRGERGGCCFGH